MAPSDAAAKTCTVDRSALVRRMRDFAVPRPVAPYVRSNALVQIGENGLADFRLASATRRLAELALEYCGGNVEWAADELGVNSATVRRWLHEWARLDAAPPSLAVVPALEPGRPVP